MECMTLQAYIVITWSVVSIQQDWIDGNLLSLYKGNGEKSICDHYRGITLLESFRKVLPRLILNKLIEDNFPRVMPNFQSGDRSDRGTVDMFLSVRQI